MTTPEPSVLELEVNGEDVLLFVDEDGTIHCDDYDEKHWLIQVAEHHRDASEQESKWKTKKNGYARTLLRYHPFDKKAVQYGKVRATRVEMQDNVGYYLDAFIDELLAEELTQDEQEQVLRAFCDIDPEKLPEHLKARLDRHRYSVPRQPYIKTTTTARRI